MEFDDSSIIDVNKNFQDNENPEEEEKEEGIDSADVRTAPESRHLV